MATLLANAYPRKHFFFEMFTRDLSLEDCILDLIDNSIDGLIRSHDLDISATLLADHNLDSNKNTTLPKITINISERSFEIRDTCGGIPKKLALNDVFNFGHAPGATGGTLGVYGIGLKRAIFKIGETFDMESHTPEDGFEVKLDVKKWVEQDEDLKDWRIPLENSNAAESLSKSGTTIKVGRLREEVRMRIVDGKFEQNLRNAISQAYCLFIGRFVEIILNKISVAAFRIPLGASNEIEPGHDSFSQGGVSVELIASLAERQSDSKSWKAENAGWYILCNGRVILVADKTELTGWGPGLKQFHEGKYRGFIGIAFFKSDSPMLLPWTTTKRGLNRESPVYQMAKNRMRGIAIPILSFLDRMYSQSDGPEEPIERGIADQVRPVSISSIASSPMKAFGLNPASRQAKTTVRIQYDAEIGDVERVKKHLRKYSIGANRVGEITFTHYLKNECPE